MPGETRFGARVRAAVHLLDLLAVLAVPGVLVVVFALPATTRESLALSAGSPTPVTAYTAHFVHLEAGHLAGNLAIYALVVPAAYLLAALGDYRRVFFIPFVSILVSFPFVLSGLHLVLDSSGRVLGFSGLTMAFVGMIPLFETVYLSSLGGEVRLDNAPTLFFAGVALIAARIVPSDPEGVAITLAAAAITLAYAWYARFRLRAATLRDLLDRFGEFETAVGAGVTFFVALYFGFPADPARSGRIVGVYTHFLGYALGFVSTYLVLRIDDPTFRVPSPPDPPP